MRGKTSSDLFNEAIPNVANPPRTTDFTVRVMSHDTSKKEEEKPASNEVRADENAVCEVCGKFGAFALGDSLLCLDCYEKCGSCCTGEFE